MFEKEADEYRKDLKSKFFLSEPQLDLACQGFKDGYNKANEWHDLRKNPNDLPNTHCLNWVIALYDNGTLWCRAKREECVDGIFWVNSYHYQIYNVIAWKEVIPPKEIDK